MIVKHQNYIWSNNKSSIKPLHSYGSEMRKKCSVNAMVDKKHFQVSRQHLGWMTSPQNTSKARRQEGFEEFTLIILIIKYLLSQWQETTQPNDLVLYILVPQGHRLTFDINSYKEACPRLGVLYKLGLCSLFQPRWYYVFHCFKNTIPSEACHNAASTCQVTLPSNNSHSELCLWPHQARDKVWTSLKTSHRKASVLFFCPLFFIV